MYIAFLIKIHVGNLTKAIEQVQRLALILHILKTVSRKLFNLINEVLIFERLDNTFKNLILNDSLIDTDFIIDNETCFNAMKFMDHYLTIKKILAGCDSISNKVITERNSKKNTNKQINLFKHISYSLNSGQIIFSYKNKISQASNRRSSSITMKKFLKKYKKLIPYRKQSFMSFR